jgi:hypothetical protein
MVYRYPEIYNNIYLDIYNTMYRYPEIYNMVYRYPEIYNTMYIYLYI